MNFVKRSHKKYHFHSSDHMSPTHHQLARFMQSAGLQRTRWAWRAKFSESNLNFAPDACECLEFKHLLSQMVDMYCPTVMPETYVINEFSWSTILSDIASMYYATHQTIEDHVEGLAWILKPALLNNGQHIKIFDTLSQIEEHLLRPDHLAGPHVLQRYILDPALYDGKKYSMRFFVVITQEAGAFLYPHGYLNVALNKYPGADFTNLSAHLTNEHLMHHMPSVVQIPTMDITDYAAWYPQVETIVHAVTKGLEQAFPRAYMPQKERTFAVFGFDFMLDEHQRAWLLEVNHGPCFPTDEQHPLQERLYRPFWEAVLEQFVLPITTHQPMLMDGSSGFKAMRVMNI
ncbi:MAG: tubulin-tyrosine ligase [Legionella sp.]|nr:MAG: tubulin-tyrosine ligase [Legionella sp.]